jgi:hypothetical protein
MRDLGGAPIALLQIFGVNQIRELGSAEPALMPIALGLGRMPIALGLGRI